MGSLRVVAGSCGYPLTLTRRNGSDSFLDRVGNIPATTRHYPQACAREFRLALRPRSVAVRRACRGSPAGRGSFPVPVKSASARTRGFRQFSAIRRLSPASRPATAGKPAFRCGLPAFGLIFDQWAAVAAVRVTGFSGRVPGVAGRPSPTLSPIHAQPALALPD